MSDETADGARRSPNWGLGIAIGLPFVVVFGTAMDNWALGIALGAAFAVVFASTSSSGRKRPDDDAS